MNRSFPIVLLTLSLSHPAAAEIGNWPSFQNGGTVSLPSDSSIELGDVQWTCDLPGYGQSTPVVYGPHVYVTTVDGDNRDEYHLICIERGDGSIAWKHTIANASPRAATTMVSRAAPTPAVDAAGVVCFFEGGNVLALTHSGAPRWNHNLVEEFGDVGARHGLSASVEQDQDSVFIWVERSKEPYVVCLSKETGDIEWKVEGVGGTSWASPRLVPVNDGHHLVLSGSGSLIGLDPKSGDRLWTFDGINGNTSPTPMPLGNGRFLIGASGGRGGDAAKRASASNGVIQISQVDDNTWTADYVWQARRATSSFGSPIVHDGLACFVNRQGVCYALNADTGKEAFVKRLKGSTWATPIALGHQIFFFSREGQVSALSTTSSNQKITTWDGLPEPPKPEPASEEESAGPAGMSTGPVLYAATWCGDAFLLRRGTRLFSVAASAVGP